MRKANLVKLSELQYWSFKNSLRLHKESVVILEAGMPDTAFFVSIIALEELGKCFWIDDIIFNTTYNDWDLRAASDGLRRMYNHKLKQWRPFLDLSRSETKKIYAAIEHIENGKLDVLKQNSLYVGLQGRKVTGRIILPSITRPKAKRQIRVLNGFFLHLVESRKLGSRFDGYFIDRLVTRRLLPALSEISIIVA